MLTHNEVNKLNRKLIKTMGIDEAPRVIKAITVSDSSIVAIHLLNPSYLEIDDALEVAVRDNFKCIVIHTAKTFGKAG
jgi:hypothetical protein